MNKLTKIGVSALAGSLAAVSAGHAGSLSVKGGATVSWTQNEGETTGNPLGMNSGMTFTGAGELDNGSTFTLTLTQADQTAYSAGSIALAIPGFGTLTLDQSGGGIDRFDDMMPTAWEETNGAGLASTLNTVAGSGGSTNVEWTVDSGMLPDGMSAYVAVSPAANAPGNVNDKAQGGAGNNIGGVGWDFAVSHNALYDGLNVFAGISNIEQTVEEATRSGDRNQYVLGATYAMGGFTVGYQISKDDLALANGTHAYENEAWGVSFSVNDDLSMSYGSHESEALKTGAIANVTLEAESFQIAYSMGGATLKIAESSVDNNTYTSGSANSKDGTTIALTLAF